MSTILKALRRLEDDQAPDPNSSDVLREQILTEELAAHAALGGEEESTPMSAALLVFRKHRGPTLATAVILLCAALIGVSLGNPDRDPSVNGQTNAQSNTLATAGSTRQLVASTEPSSNPYPSAEPTSAPGRVALRPVETVNRATTDASPVSRGPSIPVAALPMETPQTLGTKLEARSTASPASRPALVAAAGLGASSNAEAGSLRLARTPSPKATPSVPEVVRRKAPVDLPRIAKPAIPDLSVLRTAWHPQPERRSARIQLAKSEDVMTLREGDAVGSLVVKEITPSSVLFAAGDVELRRRVGN
mgnify:FL=1